MTLLSTGWTPFPSPSQQCQSTEKYTLHTPQAYLGVFCGILVPTQQINEINKNMKMIYCGTALDTSMQQKQNNADRKWKYQSHHSISCNMWKIEISAEIFALQAL